VIDADRYARSHSSDPEQYREALMTQQRAMIERQLADAASVLAEVWMFEWKEAGSPNSCRSGGFLPIATSFDMTNGRIPSR
jgi:hypothetical protein